MITRTVKRKDDGICDYPSVKLGTIPYCRGLRATEPLHVGMVLWIPKQEAFPLYRSCSFLPVFFGPDRPQCVDAPNLMRVMVEAPLPQPDAGGTLFLSQM